MESTKVQDGTGLQTPSGVHVHDGISTRNVHYIYVCDATGTHLVYTRYTAMGLSDSGDVSGSCSTVSAYSCAATTGSVTVTVADGRAPFTYAWSHVSGVTATVNSPTEATTTFTRDAAGSAGGTQYVGVYRCTVTDATGRTATNDVTVTTTHTSTYTPLAASKSGNAAGSCSFVSPATECTATTNTVTVTASGGVGPYTYAWSYVSGTAATVTSGTSASTTFSRTQTGIIAGTEYVGTYRCTVTDSLSSTATVDVTVTTTHSDTYVAPALGISKSGDASGACNYSSPATECAATTNSVTVTASGGTPPYTYAWANQSGTTATVNSPTAAITSFTRTAAGSLSGTAYSGVYRCTVTDADLSTITVDVTVATTHTQNPDPLAASASAGTVTGSCSYATPTTECAATTGSVTITPSGGIGPYTYAWANVSGATATVNASTAATTTFTRTASGTNGGQLYSGVYRCTVTDSQLQTTTVDVTVNTTHTNTYVALSASKSGNASGSCSTNNGNGCTATTNTVTISASNGAPGYTYAWSKVSGTTYTVNSPTSAATTFSLYGSGTPAGTNYSATYRCTITDSIGYTTTVDVTVSTTHTDSYVAMSLGKSADAYGSCSYQTGNCTATTNWVDISVSGGLGGYSYAWSYLSGSGATVNSPTNASTFFSRNATGTQTLSGWYRCTVTDATGRSAAIDVYVQTTHTLTYTPMSLSKDADAWGSCLQISSIANCTAVTNTSTISVSGGQGPFTYSWSYLSGDTFTVNSPSSAGTYFAKTARNNVFPGTYRCTVTDATSATATIDVLVQTEHYYEI